MRKVVLVLAASFFFLQLTTAQVKLGVKAGISTLDISPNDITLSDGNSLSLNEAKYGFHFGLMSNIKLGGFFIQPEVLVNTNTVEYKLSELTLSDVTNDFFTESHTSLDIPLLVGFKVGPLRLNGGPVGHIHLTSNSELSRVEGFKEDFSNMTYGWQAGLGLDVGKIRIDARYEGNFNRFGDHLNYENTNINFDDRPGRFVASVGYMF